MRNRACCAIAVTIAIVSGVACGGDKSAAPKAEKVAAVEGAMCEEHGVLEAICTKCNPKLIPVFQAKGDWCEEHGFPESVCPICHPERGGKPAGEVSADKAPADGTKVRLDSKDTARVAGIATVKAEARAGGARLEVVAVIAYDARKHAEVNARATGVVRALHADVGDVVKAGAPLAAIESASVGTDRSRLASASSRLRIAEQNHQREKALFESGVSSEKDVLTALQELESARAEKAAATASLGVVGGGTTGSGYVLRSPIAGTVTNRRASIGHMVDLEEILFDVVDVSVMRAELDIPESDLGLVRPGHEVTLVVDGLGEREFRGTVDYIAPEVDRETRTAKARVTLANPDGALRANMFARARIALAAERPTVMVPRDAIQRVAEIQLLFVELAPGEYEARRIKTGVNEGADVEIITGIKAGESVVTKGSFQLKTETLKGSIGAGCCE